MSDVSEFLRWSSAIETGHAQMDDTHREFVALMDALLAAPDDELLARLDGLIEHTRVHFEQEVAWMEATDFPPIGCHRREHDTVMETAVEVRRRVSGGDLALARKLVAALAEWFHGHAQGMDKVLAFWMAEHARGTAPTADPCGAAFAGAGPADSATPASGCCDH